MTSLPSSDFSLHPSSWDVSSIVIVSHEIIESRGLVETLGLSSKDHDKEEPNDRTPLWTDYRNL